MANARAFDWICEQIEQRSSLSRLEARGTVRLALKKAGLDAATVKPQQMGVVLEKVLPAEFESRGVEGGAEICAALKPHLAQLSDDAASVDAPEQVFARLGGQA
jgi:hypothetical protein